MKDIPNKVEYRIRDLPTRSVTLFPSRAQVTREIKDVPLEPGNNEIVIVGLTPTVDEHSIKVEGTGSTATITDIAVQLLPNRELFQDIYPDSDDEDEGEVESDRESGEETDDQNKEAKKKLDGLLQDIDDKLVILRDDSHRAKEVIASAAVRLKLLDSFGETLKQKECNITIEDGLATYRAEREKVFQDHMEATVEERKIAREILDVAKEERSLKEQRRKLSEKSTKIKRKAREAKRKQQAKEDLRRAEAKKEKDRIRREREQFWPRSCYTVRITLDAAAFTPSSSRRTSIASASDLVKFDTEKDSSSPSSADAANPTCDISFSYVTTSAYWAPSYDLALSTTTNSAKLCFDAALTNMTSEVWSNCKITLSNSQTTFSLNNDVIPSLKPWHIKLAGKGQTLAKNAIFANNSNNFSPSANEILDSREERTKKQDWSNAQNMVASKPRAQMFGVSNNNNSNNSSSRFRDRDREQARGAYGAFGQQMAQAPIQQQQQQQQQQTQQQAASASLFGGPSGGGGASAFGAPAAPTGGPFGQVNSSAAATGGLFGNRSAMATNAISTWTNSDPDRHAGAAWEQEEVDGATILEPTPELSFQESSFEETGMTTTYDLPGLKTLKPNATVSKQRVAQITFPNVVFSRTVVAKYTPVAYLKAKLRNSSKLSLLKGPTGLTLDGTFMSRSMLPRCSAGEFFSLSLGVDPAIKVAYPKPEVKRSTTGLFSKEDSSTYTRTITLLNTRAAAGRHVNITVFDQVPVSEDEKLRVGTLHPRGLTVDGAAVATGVAGREGEKDWGKATAVLKKGGEVVWDVALNAGRSVKLTLEYEVSAPTGENVTQC